MEVKMTYILLGIFTSICSQGSIPVRKCKTMGQTVDIKIVHLVKLSIYKCPRERNHLRSVDRSFRWIRIRHFVGMVFVELGHNLRGGI